MLLAEPDQGLRYYLLKKAGLGPRVEANAWMNNQQAIQARELLSSFQFSALESFLEQVYTRNPDFYGLVIASLAHWFGQAPFIQAYRKQYSSSLHALAISARHQLYGAWHERTHTLFNRVSERKWNRFYEKLDKSYKWLHKAISLNPDYAEAYSQLILVALSSEAEETELYASFAALKIKSQQHLFGHCNMLYALGERFGGSFHSMSNFAIKSCNDQPPLNPLHILIPLAHIENWAFLSRHKSNKKMADAYFQKHDVGDAILDSYYLLLGCKDYKHNEFTSWFASIFLMAFYQMKNDALAIENLKHISQGCSIYPLQYMASSKREKWNTGFIVERLQKQLKI